MANDVTFRTEGVAGRITLSRPQALNALTLEMCTAMLAQLHAWADDPKIAAVIIDAAPGRAFCAGGDIRIVSQWGKDGDPRALQFFSTEYTLNAFIKHFPKPYVALIDGICMGGGVGISIHGSHRVVTENALFAMPETAIGFFCDVGGSYFLSRMPGAIGTYLGLTGARLKPADMLYTGAATHFVPSKELPDIAARIAAGEAVASVLELAQQRPGAAALPVHCEIIDRIFALDRVEAIIDALGNAGDFGSEALKMLSRASPTSVKLVRRELEEGKGRDLNACLEMEFQIVARIVKGHDFAEGVRALLIDKDNAPAWRPPHLEQVSLVDIAPYFAPSVPPIGL
jgi:enoyl-CoA hydratase/carnithine racemase